MCICFARTGLQSKGGLRKPRHSYAATHQWYAACPRISSTGCHYDEGNQRMTGQGHDHPQAKVCSKITRQAEKHDKVSEALTKHMATELNDTTRSHMSTGAVPNPIVLSASRACDSVYVKDTRDPTDDGGDGGDGEHLPCLECLTPINQTEAFFFVHCNGLCHNMQRLDQHCDPWPVPKWWARLRCVWSDTRPRATHNAMPRVPYRL